MTFLDAHYDQILKWWKWFYEDQQVYDDNKNGLNYFLWGARYMGPDDYVYYSSGLDDYPRNDTGLVSKYHLDLHVWEIVFTQIMANIAEHYGDTDNIAYLNEVKNQLIQNLDTFLDPTDYLYKDIFTDVNDKSKIIHSQHIGYISLLPMIFGLVD